MATPTTVPSISPVSVNMGALEPIKKIGTIVAVYVRLPDAFLKRPVPPVI
jgi:hypothetical protein